MQKVYYVSKNSITKNNPVPDMDRFERIEKLNRLLELGWSIKEMKSDGNGDRFILEKAD